MPYPDACRWVRTPHRQGLWRVQNVNCWLMREACCALIATRAGVPFRVQDTDEQGTKIGQAGRLRVDALPARLDWDRAAATDTDIEVQPVLGCFALRYHLEADPRPLPAGIDDAVRASAQLILWPSEVSPVRIPAGEAI